MHGEDRDGGAEGDVQKFKPAPKASGIISPLSTFLSPNVQQMPSLPEQKAPAVGEGLEEASGKESSHVVPKAQKFKPGHISQRRAGESSPG